jgi:integrase
MRGHVPKRERIWTVVGDIGRDKRGGRKQRWHSLMTKGDADDRFIDILKQLKGDTYVEPSEQTLESFLHEWLEATRRRVRPSTADSYKRNIDQHVVPGIGSIQLQKLTSATLNCFYANLLETGRKDGRGGLSPRTARYSHTLIRKALADAVRWNRLARNVADQADAPKQLTPEMRTWNVAELRRFLESASQDRLYPAWVLAATTGMRRGEVLGLRWQDVDLDLGRLAVRRALISIGYRLSFTEPKTARGRRSVALDPTTISVLRDHRGRQLEERLVQGPAYEDQGLVFAKEDGLPIHPDYFSKSFGRIAKKAKVPRIPLHGLRHSYASLALAAGVHPKVVSERLGHAGISITLDTYSHAIPALDAEAANTIAALVFESSS